MRAGVGQGHAHDAAREQDDAGDADAARGADDVILRAPRGTTARRHEPCERDAGERRTRDDAEGALRDDPPRLPDRVTVGVDDVGDPVGRTAQDGGQRRHGRRDARGLDEVEERVGVPAEDDEGPEPPGAAERGADHVRADEAPLARHDEREQSGAEDGDERRRRVDAAEARDEHTGGREQPDVAAAAPSPPHGEDEPRQQHARPRLDAEFRQQRQHACAQRVRDTGDAGRPRAQPGDAARDEGRAEKADDEDERPPRALRRPAGHAERVQDAEERAHREQVAVGLVLQFAETRVRRPRVERAREVTPRRDDEVDLRVRLDDARLHEPRHEREDQCDAQREQPCARRVHPRRTRTSRFHVTISRSPGTRRTARAASGQ